MTRLTSLLKAEDKTVSRIIVARASDDEVAEAICQSFSNFFSSLSCPATVLTMNLSKMHGPDTAKLNVISTLVSWHFDDTSRANIRAQSFDRYVQ